MEAHLASTAARRLLQWHQQCPGRPGRLWPQGLGEHRTLHGRTGRGRFFLVKLGPPSAAVTSEDRCHPRGHRLPRRRVGIAVFLSVNEEVAPQALSQAGDVPALWCPLSMEPGAGVSPRVLHMQFEPLGHRPFPLLSVHIHPVLPPACPLHFIQRREREQVLLPEFRRLCSRCPRLC